jgi:hypothetical protein
MLLDISLVMLLLVILENFCIFLNALESLETEVPTLEKSIILLDKLWSVGEKIRVEGVFV